MSSPKTPPHNTQKRVSKYTGLIVAVVIFILFDISILTLNFYLADEIRRDTEIIDIAGRQRTLSQRISRAVTEFELLALKQHVETLDTLDFENDLDNEFLSELELPEPTSEELEALSASEIADHYDDEILTEEQVALDNAYLGRLEDLRNELQDQISVFDWTQEAFLHGGKTVDTDNNTFELEAVENENARQILQTTQIIWDGFKSKLDVLMVKPASAYLSRQEIDTNLQEASVYAQNNNQKLFKLMDQLTQELANNASGKATTLRLLQFGGIAGALLFFLVIMFSIMLRFRTADAKLDAAKKETDDILSNVGGGLFLLDRNMEISSQHSAELTRIFNDVELAGTRFDRMLSELLPKETHETAIDYIELLLGDRVNENLVADLNPMSEVEVNFTDGRGGFNTKFLEFKFSRAIRNGKIEFLLVTVNDISARVRLAKDLEAAHEHREAQLELLMNILHINPQELLMFIDEAELSLNKINDILRESNTSHEDNRNKVSKIYRIAHALKGDASALDLEIFENMAHQFEDELDAIRKIQQPDGNDFIPLVVKLEDILSHLQSIKEIALRLSDLGSAVNKKLTRKPGENTDYTEEDALTDNWAFIDQLKDKVANAEGKTVEVLTNGISDGNIPEAYRKLIRDAVIQLTRNAIVHGIETPSERQSRGKDLIGKIQIIFEPTDDGGYELIFRDDGQGVVRQKIIDAAVRKGILTAEKASTLNPNQSYGLIFHPGFSTAEVTSEHAGRGVGMDIVRDKVREAGGKMRFKTSVGKSTEFRIVLPSLQVSDTTEERHIT
ncbi:CheA signal transduction histidine kinase [gamma proteobacterium HTCC5015]|nr:CheA signal transduction histidine kinase [gamma proteobacterium HTCC5015]